MEQEMTKTLKCNYYTVNDLQFPTKIKHNKEVLYYVHCSSYVSIYKSSNSCSVEV
jgi:hypothetical protein